MYYYTNGRPTAGCFRLSADNSTVCEPFWVRKVPDSALGECVPGAAPENSSAGAAAALQQDASCNQLPGEAFDRTGPIPNRTR